MGSPPIREIDVADEATMARFVQAAPPDQLWLGLDRYRRKVAG